MSRLVAVFTLIAALAARAEGPTPEELKRENEALRERLARMERVMAEHGIAPPEEASAPGAGAVSTGTARKPMGEVVVTATRGEAGTKTTGSTISTVSGVEIGQQHVDEAMEPLRGVPGVHVLRTGVRGGLTSLFTRGLNSNHTAVLLEGFELTRDGGQFFELDTLTTDAVGGIEVLRGPQSALYGSDAVGGVVNFRIPRGNGPGRVRPSIEFGSYASNREKVSVQGGDDRFGFNFEASRFEQSNGRIDHSDYEIQGATGRFDFDLSDRTRLMVVVRAQEDDLLQFSNASGPRFDPLLDPDANGEKDSLLVGLDFGTWITDWWDAHVQLQHYALNRDSFDDPDLVDPFGLFNTIDEYTKGVAHLYSRFYPCKWDTVTVGVEFEDQELESMSQLFNFDVFPPVATSNLVEEDRKNRSFYMQHEFAFWDMVYLTPGARWDDNESFGTQWTGRVAGAVWIEQTGTKPRASYGTAITEPNFFQTFDAQFGNSGLVPEHNEGWDVGVDQWLCDDRVRASVTYFHNKLDDVIQFETTAFFPVFDGTFSNAGRARTEGVEAEVHWDVAKGVLRDNDVVTTSASYTWLDTEVIESNTPTSSTFKEGGSLIRRPRNTAHLNLDYAIVDCLDVNLDFNYFGDRKDVSFVFGRPPREVANGFLRVDLAASYRLPWVKGLRVMGRAENLLDKDYDEVLGFPAPGFNFLGGLEYEVRF
ncbi:MAG: TonB-dependent receptor [Planctomycetota bacterium]